MHFITKSSIKYVAESKKGGKQTIWEGAVNFLMKFITTRVLFVQVL